MREMEKERREKDEGGWAWFDCSFGWFFFFFVCTYEPSGMGYPKGRLAVSTVSGGIDDDVSGRFA